MGSDPDLDSELAAARLDAAAAARRRRRTETEVAQMETSLRRVLAGVAATGAEVTVETVDGRTHRGVVTGLGDDVVVWSTLDGRRVALRIKAIAALECDGPLVVDERPRAGGSSTLHEVVASFAGTRQIVTVVCHGGRLIEGEIAWCGEDVAGVRPTGMAKETVVYLASVSELSSSASSA